MVPYDIAMFLYDVATYLHDVLMLRTESLDRFRVAIVHEIRPIRPYPETTRNSA